MHPERVRRLLERKADEARAPSCVLSVPIEIAPDPGASIVAACFLCAVLDVLLGVGRGESGKALSPRSDGVERLHDRRDELFMRLHIDDAARRQSARGLKVSHPLLGCRAKVGVDRDGEAVQGEELLDPLSAHLFGAAFDRSIEIDFLLHSLRNVGAVA